MILFRTILLWLSFAMLLLSEALDGYPNIKLGLTLRLFPTGLLVLWFLLSVFFREKLKINASETPKWALTSLRYIRPISSLSIILGAILKLVSLYSGNWFLVAGIGFMAFYSTLLGKYAVNRKPHEDIIDEQEL